MPGQESRSLEATELCSPIITLQPSEPKPITFVNGILKSDKVFNNPLYKCSAFAEDGLFELNTVCSSQNVLSIRFVTLSNKTIEYSIKYS